MRWSASQALAWIIRQKPLELRNNEWTADMGPKLSEAQKKLAGLIASSKVKAWGRRAPHGLFEEMPSDPFRISDVTVVVGAHGDMTTTTPHKPYAGPHWHTIEFEADEIKREYPEPPPPSAQEWMLSNADKGDKRDYMLGACRRATGCTKRAAEAAYKNLPNGLRRKRGRPVISK